MAASNWLEEGVLNYFFRNQAVTQPTTLYLALYSTNPTDADTGVELSGVDYERQEIAFNMPTQIGGKGTIVNSGIVDFGIAGGAWGTVSHWAIHNHATAGEMLAYGPFNHTDTIYEGNRFEIQVGAIEITHS